MAVPVAISIDSLRAHFFAFPIAKFNFQLSLKLLYIRA